jgi:hypothetical protein
MSRQSRPLTGRLIALAAGTVLTLALGPAVAPQQVDAARGYRFDVAKRGDFVAQTNFVQCVGASMQMMLNMIEPGRDRTARTQLRLQRLARRLSPARSDGQQRQGASVIGWAAGLNVKEGGLYLVVGTDTLREALGRAARAIRATGKPVGLLMWHGRHAWVMSGFRATADPLEDLDAKVTEAIVYDPLYPHGSSVWGRSPRPGQALAVSELGRQFVPRRSWRPGGSLSRSLAGKYVVVLPYLTHRHLAEGL